MYGSQGGTSQIHSGDVFRLPTLIHLSSAELSSLVLKLLEEVAVLRRTVAAQRDEIARLKGGPGRPNIKSGGMEQRVLPSSWSRTARIPS